MQSPSPSRVTAVPTQGTMSETIKTGDDGDAAERRVNHSLRSLVDDMLRQIRIAGEADQWTEEERTRAESDLQRIMESIRHRAFDGHRSTTTD